MFFIGTKPKNRLSSLLQRLSPSTNTEVVDGLRAVVARARAITAGQNRRVHFRQRPPVDRYEAVFQLDALAGEADDALHEVFVGVQRIAKDDMSPRLISQMR